MAPLPKRKLSRGRGRRRLEGQIRVTKITQTLTNCANCKKQVIAHRVCSYCGYYKGKKVISVKAK